MCTVLGSLVIVFNVFLQPEHGHPIDGDGSSVVAFKANSDGLAWSFLSYVALAEDYQWSGEGPNESTLSLLAGQNPLLATEILLENTAGVLRIPPPIPIGVLPGRQPATFSIYADARYIDDVVVSQADGKTLMCVIRMDAGDGQCV